MRRAVPALVIVALSLARACAPVAAAQIPPLGGTAAYVADLAARRERAMAALGPDTVLVLWSAPPRTYSADIDYPYRQDSNLLYLTGVAQQNTVLVLVPGAASQREFLFVERNTAVGELWTGHLMTPREATAASGIQTIYVEEGTGALDAFMNALIGGSADGGLPKDAVSNFARVSAAAAAGRLTLALGDVLPDPGVPALAAPPSVQWARGLTARHPSVTLTSAVALLARERQIKTAYEQRVLRQSAAISAAAHVEAMKRTRPGRWEYEIKSTIEHAFLSHGALSWGYPSIVGSGPNATTLHYLAGTRQLRAGELLLVDAAGTYQGLTADITRTYPVSRRFSREQRALYDLVLSAEEAGIAAARPGVGPETVTGAIREVFRRGLPALGLVEMSATGGELDAQVSLWFPHAPIHGIGVDVHDPLGTLEPGSAFVIEPGLYIRADAFDRLPDTPGRRALARALAPGLAKYGGMGVRVEDSFLMTPAGPVMLSGDAPRQVADLERVVGTGR
jgi:Xaa-Pro aminopeptidase